MQFKLAFIIGVFTLAITSGIASAEPPLKGYRGILTPTDYYGIFTLFNPNNQKLPTHSSYVDRNATYFRLRGIETTPDALRKIAAGLMFNCEERGQVSSSMKWSCIFGQPVKVYSSTMKEYQNDQTTEVFRPVQG